MNDLLYEYCFILNRPEEEFLNSTLGKVVFMIEKARETKIDDNNFKIYLVKSLGARIPFIKTKNHKEKDVMVDSFDDILYERR